MGKLKKATKKELFGDKKGETHIMYNDHGKLYPFCILCGKIIKGECMTGLWYEPDFKRNYVYDICIECSTHLGEDVTTHKIEERVMAIIASSIPRYKVK